MMSSPGPPSSVVNVPNLICLVRLLFAPGLIVLARFDREMAFLGLAVTLLLTDWIDGRIARAWKQETVFGARFDAFSDVAIYVCIAWGLGLLRRETFWAERPWLIAILGSYTLSLIVCWVKFGCLPNYHTRLAKASWLFVTVGVIALMLDLSIWPLRLAFATVIAANVESIAVTLTLRAWRTDIRTIFDARRHSAKTGDRNATSANER